MPKKLTVEEKQAKRWQNDTSLVYALRCKCGKIHELLKYTHYYCNCQRNLLYFSSPNRRNCTVLYDRDAKKEE